MQTLTLPADAYPSHDYLPNDFGECLGCGLAQYATCHPLTPYVAPRVHRDAAVGGVPVVRRGPAGRAS